MENLTTLYEHEVSNNPPGLADVLTTTASLEESSGGIQCSLKYAECDLARMLWIVACPIILLLGTVGNVLIILVMSHKSLRSTAFGCYLISISAVDLIGIWVGLTRHFIKNLTKVDIRKVHQSICWLQRFFLYGSTNTSVWLLTAVTLERTLSIYCPTRSIKFKSLGRTKLIIATIIVIQYGWNVHLFFTRGVEYSTDGNMTVVSTCGYPNNASRLYYESNMQIYLAMVDYSLIPFIAMLSMNIAIFLRLRKRDKKYSNCTNLYNGSVLKPKAKKSNVSHKTLMLLPVTIFFLVTTLPSLAFTGVENMRLRQNETDLDRARMEVADFCVSILMYLNHSLNFFLYCLTGKMFRTRCWNLLTRCCRNKENDSWDTVYNRSPMTFKRPSISASYSHSAAVTPTPTPPRSRTNTNTSAKPPPRPFAQNLTVPEVQS